MYWFAISCPKNIEVWAKLNYKMAECVAHF